MQPATDRSPFPQESTRMPTLSLTSHTIQQNTHTGGAGVGGPLDRQAHRGGALPAARHQREGNLCAGPGGDSVKRI